MGIVYRGYDPVIKRPVAIKTIRRELIEEDERAESLAGRFRKEAQAAGALNHPGIVSIYEYGEDTNHAFIAMEYVEGNSLREYLARGARFEERDIVSIMSQLLDALDFAHKRTVWHRDVKPANIIIMGNGRIKLADFGIARIESSDRTLANVIMGTPGYIAPEHYLGQPARRRFAAGPRRSCTTSATTIHRHRRKPNRAAAGASTTRSFRAPSPRRRTTGSSPRVISARRSLPSTHAL